MIIRAILHLVRKPSSTLVILLTLLVITYLVSTTCSMLFTARNTVDELRSDVGGSIKLEFDLTNYVLAAVMAKSSYFDESAYTYSGNYIPKDLTEEIAEIEGVVAYNAIAELLCAASDFNFIPGTVSTNDEYSTISCSAAVTVSESYKYFKSGRYELTGGRHIEKDDINKTLITRELADYNGLSIGDEVTINFNDVEVRLEIVGIYERHDEDENQMTTLYGYGGNKLIASFSSYEELHINEEDGKETGAEYVVFYADSPDRLSSIARQISDITDYFKITIDSSEYDAVAGPLLALERIMIVLLVIIVVTSSFLLILVVIMLIKQRSREVGIYMSLGIKKITILNQFILEALITATLTFLAAYLAKVTDILTGITTRDLIWILSVETIIIIISDAAAFMSIIHRNPKEIMSEMS